MVAAFITVFMSNIFSGISVSVLNKVEGKGPVCVIKLSSKKQTSSRISGF